MQWCGSTNKSPTKLNAVEIKFDTVIFLRIGKITKAETPPGDFKVTIPKNPPINNRAITSKNESYQLPLAYPKLPTYSWIFTSISNWIDLVVALFLFNAQIQYVTNQWSTDPSMWLTPTTWRKLLTAKFFTSCAMKTRKLLGYKTLWRKNAIASFRENKALGHSMHV